MRYGIVGNKNVKRLPRDRIAYLDFLRVFSMIFVVMIHVVFDLFNNATVSSSEWQIFNAYDSLSRWSVPVFVMISGALFLDSKKPFGQILKKNVLRLAIAYVVWTIIYSTICNIYYNDFNTTLDQLINGHFHMWFILMMIGLYLVTPLLRKIVEEKSTIRLFLILALIFAMFLPDLVKVLESFPSLTTQKIIQFINQTKYNFNVFVPLGYAGYFVLGYVLNKFEISKKLECAIYIMGAAGFVYTLLATYLRSNAAHFAYVGFYEYTSTNVAMMAAAVFVFFKKHYRVKKSDSLYSKTVSRLSKYSFGVYLVHVAVLEYMTVRLHYSPMAYSPLISSPVFCIVTLIISYVISFILNQIPFLNDCIV